MSSVPFASCFYKTNLLDLEKTYFHLDENNTINTTHAPNLITKIKSFFTFEQDKNLLAVNKRLQEIVLEIKQLKGSSFFPLLNEMSPKQHDIFIMNLTHIASIFDKANKRNRLTLFCLKIVNFFRKLFRQSKIELITYEKIDKQEFVKLFTHREELRILHNNKKKDPCDCQDNQFNERCKNFVKYRAKKIDTINRIPEKVLKHVVSYFLDIRSLNSLGLTCKTNQKLFKDDLKEYKESKEVWYKCFYLMFYNFMREGIAEMDFKEFGHSNWDTYKFTPETLDERYLKLKEEIVKINKKWVNTLTYYRDGMMTRSTPLLLHAIVEIEHPERRREIVGILLEKGADPRINGFYYQEIDVLESAKATNDPELVSMLEKAIATQ